MATNLYYSLLWVSPTGSRDLQDQVDSEGGGDESIHVFLDQPCLVGGILMA